MQTPETAADAVANKYAGKSLTLQDLRGMPPEDVANLRPADIASVRPEAQPLPPHESVDARVMEQLRHDAAPQGQPTRKAADDQLEQIIARQKAEAGQASQSSGFADWAAGFSERDGITLGFAVLVIIAALVILVRRTRRPA